MARQLIYTSAEHGLAAGRSGFCTVAQHADLRERLIAELERLSAFDRPPAGQPLPVIRSHRILTVGSDRYHILSCIQDAGPDYSGRTNHIAHHLICEENELTVAASPALVLLRFPWRQRWTESSRYLGDADQIDLSRFREPVPTGGGWKELTGNPAHALLLLESKARQGCYVAYAVKREDLLLEVFDESLGKITFKSLEKKWQIPFTTLLQATDNPRDFSWRGCWAGSSTHHSAVVSGETVFDLTRTSSLPSPAPPPSEVARAVTVTAVPPRSKVQVVTAVKPPRKQSMWHKVRSRYEGLSAEEVQHQLAGQIPPEVLAAREKGLKRRRLVLLLLPLLAIPVLAFIAIAIKQVLEKSPSSSTLTVQVQPLTNNASLSASEQNLQATFSNAQGKKSVDQTNLVTSLQTNQISEIAKEVEQSPKVLVQPSLVVPATPKINELDQIPLVLTYFAVSDADGLDVSQIPDMKLTSYSQFEFANSQFPVFPTFRNGSTNSWSEDNAHKLREGAVTEFTLSEDARTLTRGQNTGFSVAAIHFIKPNSFNLFLRWKTENQENQPWLKPVILPTKYLYSSGSDGKYPHYGLTVDLRERLKLIRPASSNQVVTFRLKADWVKNFPIQYIRSPVYTNRWNIPSDFEASFSPYETDLAINEALKTAKTKKETAEKNAKDNARNNNRLIIGWNGYGQSMLKVAGITESGWSFTEKQKISADQNPTWSDYCDYLQSLLTYLKEQQFGNVESIDSKWQTICQAIQNAKKSTECTSVAESMSEVEKNLSTIAGSKELGKVNRGNIKSFANEWANKINANSIRGLFTELEKSDPKKLLQSSSPEIDNLSSLLPKLPATKQDYGSFWLEIRYQIIDCKLIEFMDTKP